MDSVITALKVVPAIFVALFPIVNPIGATLVLYQMTGPIDHKVWIAASRKIAVYIFLLLSAFLLFGGAILKFFGVSIPLVQLSGGLVVASIAWGLLTREDAESASGQAARPQSGSLDSKLFFPFTFPTTIGPGSLAVAMTFGAHVDRGTQMHVTLQYVGAIVGVFVIAVVTGICFARLKWITEKFSPAGVQALSRILAFFLFCIGVGIAWEGWTALNAQVAIGGS